MVDTYIESIIKTIRSGLDSGLVVREEEVPSFISEIGKIRTKRVDDLSST